MRKTLMRTCRGLAAPGGECSRAGPASADGVASWASILAVGSGPAPASRFDCSDMFTMEAGMFTGPE